MIKKVILTETELIKLIESISISESGGIIKRLANLFGKESKAASKDFRTIAAKQGKSEFAQVAGINRDLSSLKKVDKKAYKNIKDTMKAEQEFLIKDLTLRQHGGNPLYKDFNASELKMTFNDLPNEARTWATLNKELPEFSKMTPAAQQTFRRRGEDLSKVIENKEFEKYILKRGKESSDINRKLEPAFNKAIDIRKNDQALFDLKKNLDELQFHFSGNKARAQNSGEFFQLLYTTDKQMKKLNSVVGGAHSRIVPINEWDNFMRNILNNFNMSKYKEVNVLSKGRPSSFT